MHGISLEPVRETIALRPNRTAFFQHGDPPVTFDRGFPRQSKTVVDAIGRVIHRENIITFGNQAISFRDLQESRTDAALRREPV